MVLNSVGHRNANVFQPQLSLIICRQTLGNSPICLVERCLDVWVIKCDGAEFDMRERDVEPDMLEEALLIALFRFAWH